ncbi:beta-propeller domain-containing protein [Euryarchaeota archaeon]|nr:beta-propeller domain-containing protein [Euryarchaeota archaeon]
MMKSPQSTIFVLFILLSSGCLGVIDDINEGIDDTIISIDDEYPQLDLSERIFGSPQLVSYQQCSDLLSDLKQSVYDEMLVQLDQQSYYHWTPNMYVDDMWRGGDDIALAESAEGDLSATSANSDDRKGDYSGTNNQESGVDEADFIKTDGHYIYMINGDKLLIMGVPEFGELNLLSNTTMIGSPMQMMLEGNRIVITSSINYWNLPFGHPLLDVMGHEESYTYFNGDGEPKTNTYIRYESLVMYTIVDISDKLNPVIEKELLIEGNYHTARLVDGTVRSVTHLYTYFQGIQSWVSLPNNYYQIEDRYEQMNIWNQSLLETINSNNAVIQSLTLDDFIPQMYESTSESESPYVKTSLISDDCSEFSASPETTVRGLTTIITMKMFEEVVEFEVDHITSRWAHVYSSGNTLLLAEPTADWWWFWRNDGFEDSTNIHAFDISDSNSTSYIGSGRVSGTVQDQFSMSEFQGSIRIASTSDSWGRWWLEGEIDENGDPIFTGPTNQVTILQQSDDSLVQVGIIEDIAPNETIWSARFVGDRGYLVTFENVDPLWVLDLSNPLEPQVLGELEIPGVSTYIHPVDEDHLLTIGIGPGDEGIGLDWSTTQVSLFDVSDPSNPVLSDVEVLSPGYVDENCEDIRSCGWSWSWSEASYEHKAFTYWGPEEMLAVPLSTYRYMVNNDCVYTYCYEYVSMLKMINVDIVNESLSLHGTANHSDYYNVDDSNSWYGSQTSIRRSIFMGEFIYSFSALGASVHKIDDMSIQVELDIPGHHSEDYYVHQQEEVDGESEEDAPQTS